VGPGAYQVRSHHGEWEATLYLAQPVRHDNGVWVVTRVGDPGELTPTARAPDFGLVLSAVQLALLGQRRGQRSTLFYLRLP
jgi:hypothetical protein